MPDDMRRKHEEERHPHPPMHPPHDVPPHVLRELLELREKVGRLEGMMEVLMKNQKQ